LIRGEILDQIYWENQAAKMLKQYMKRRRMTYAQIFANLGVIGVSKKEVNVARKLSRGNFSAAFMLQCLKTIDLQQLRLD
jgi:oligoribonuclease NrnB/cAMP/cGMP phosphodiesterase (DHH superfamily)